ncbi:hypothetical protein PIB30_027754 [Stylosanthes scabra]|uniref:Uncharacterized protein n=1 Tax=Stylosanthes scabra TaxID=79078 RepID=A0ABU6Y821_9FABA|nr:hypothetical protein [Stylosanthes scabra]
MALEKKRLWRVGRRVSRLRLQNWTLPFKEGEAFTTEYKHSSCCSSSLLLPLVRVLGGVGWGFKKSSRFCSLNCRQFRLTVFVSDSRRESFPSSSPSLHLISTALDDGNQHSNTSGTEPRQGKGGSRASGSNNSEHDQSYLNNGANWKRRGNNGGSTFCSNGGELRRLCSVTEGSLERWHPLAPAAAEALRTAVVAEEAHDRTIHYRGPPSFETFSLFVHPFPATDDDEDLATSRGGDGTTA